MSCASGTSSAKAAASRPSGVGVAALLLGIARIIAVADAYEAMTSDRSYRSSIGHDAARAELQRCSGTQFDERVVAAFLRIVAREARRADEAQVVAT